jgi:hypothetical protein
MLKTLFNLLVILLYKCTFIWYNELKLFSWISRWRRHSWRNHSDATTALSKMK